MHMFNLRYKYAQKAEICTWYSTYPKVLLYRKTERMLLVSNI